MRERYWAAVALVSAVEGKPCVGMRFDSFVLGRVLYGMRSLSEELRINALLEAVLGRIYIVCHWCHCVMCM